MATSQNGYLYGDISRTSVYTVTAAGRTMRFWTGAPGEMLADFIRWFDENIRNIDAGILDDWSWAVRGIRDSMTDLSNHGSGTAADVDATKWPLGVEATRYLTLAEIAKVNEKLKEYRGCIRWGANYTGRKDPMHFEINRPEAEVTQVWADIEAARAAQGPSPIVKAMQQAMHYPQQGKAMDGYWGPETDLDTYAIRQAAYAHTFPLGISAAELLVGTEPTGTWAPEDEAALITVVSIFQRAWGIEDDGIWGPMTERTWKSYQARFYS